MQLNTTALSTIPKSDFPVFAEGIYYTKIKDAKVEPTKSGGNMLKLQLVPAGEELPLHNGGMIKNTGSVIFAQFSLTATDKYDPNKRVAELSRAIKNPGDNLELAQLIGQWVKVKLAYKPAKDGYEEGNEVKKYMAIEEADGFNPPA